MNRTIPTALTLLALVGSGASAWAQSSATSAGVRDHAGMFSADAVKEADAALREVRRQTHWTSTIETLDTLNGQTVRDAALSRAIALKDHGLFVLIAKKEHKFYAEPSKSASKTFTRSMIDELDATMTRDFKAGHFDDGLRDAVSLIRRTALSAPDTASGSVSTPPAQSSSPNTTEPPVRSTPPADAEPPVRVSQPGSMMPMLLLGAGVVLLLLWVLSRAFRGASQAPPQSYNPGNAGYAPNPGHNPGPPPGYRPAPQPGYAPPPQPGYAPPPQPGYAPPPQQGGGGGFLSGVLGGAAGAVAGNILYDKFGHPHEVPAAGMPSHNAAGAAPTHDPSWSSGDTGTANPPAGGETYDPNDGGGGDWGNSSEPAPSNQASVGGDWGSSPEPVADPSTGGDWGSAPDASPSADDDTGWSAPDPEPQTDSGGGGDWGSSDPAPDDNQGGSW